MSKKKILDYNPKTGFGNFAEIMNANNAIDMAQNRVNMPSAPITPTPVAPAQAASAIPNQTPPLTDAVDATVTQNGGIPNATNTQTTVPQISNVTDTGSVSTPATDPSATLSPTQTVGTSQIVGGLKSEADWYAAQGLDPDKDYEEARAALEYDYQTSMATYGRRAEELAQMGLSNSGISDVYQLGAFNTYLANQNALANQKIAAKKKNRQDYEAYVKTFNAQEEAEIGNAATALIQSNYTQDRENSVRDLYRARGWSEEKIDKLIGQLNAYSGAFNNKIQNAYNEIVQSGSYDPNTKGTLGNFYKENGWTDAEVNELIGKLDSYNATAAEETVDKVVNEDTGAVTIDQMLKILDAVSQKIGKDSESYIAEKNKVADKIADTINWALEPDDEGSPKRLGDAEVATALGFDAEEWAKKSDGEREDAVMDAAGELHKDGDITDQAYDALVDNWVRTEIKQHIDTDNVDWTATGLVNAANVVYDLKDWKSKGYLSNEKYNDYVRKIIKQMGFAINDSGQIEWYKSVPGSEATFWYDGLEHTAFNKQVSKELSNEIHENVVKGKLNSFKGWNDASPIYAYNGKLYVGGTNGIDSKYGYYELSPEHFYTTGDNETSTDAQRQGIYEIVVALLTDPTDKAKAQTR